jgi:CRP-like cAMP-binding protein
MLAKDEIFQMLPSREIESLAEQAILRKIQRNEFVCHQGEE